MRRMLRDFAGLALLGLALASGGCAKPADVTETGALLIKLRTPTGAPQPDELRVFLYDDSGALFAGARVPKQGALPASISGRPLGTVLIQPGESSGVLRLQVRGLRLGARVLDGVTRVDDDARKHGVLDLLLETTVPADVDEDNVPDLIDDCPDQADPDQKGCPGGNRGADSGGVTDGGPEDRGAAGDLPVSGGQGGGNGGSGGGEVSGTGGAGGTGGGGAGVGGAAGSTANGSGGAGAEGPAGTGGSGEGTGGGVGTGGITGTGAASGGNGSGGKGTGGAGSGGRGTGGAATGGMGTGGAVGMRDAGMDGAPDGARKGLGALCAASTECASAFCVDGVCCQTSCDQPCQACGATGHCAAVLRAKDTPECAGTKSCNAVGRCSPD